MTTIPAKVSLILSAERKLISKMKKIIIFAYIIIIPIQCNLIPMQDILDLNDHMIENQDCGHSFFFIIDMLNGTGIKVSKL